MNTTFHHLLRLINYLQIIARLDQRSDHASAPLGGSALGPIYTLEHNINCMNTKKILFIHLSLELLYYWQRQEIFINICDIIYVDSVQSTLCMSDEMLIPERWIYIYLVTRHNSSSSPHHQPAIWLSDPKLGLILQHNSQIHFCTIFAKSSI